MTSLYYRFLSTFTFVSMTVLVVASIRADDSAASEHDGLIAQGQAMTVSGDYSLTGTARQDAELLRLSKDHTPHGEGFAIITRKQPEHHYSIEVKLPLGGSIEPGDTVFASFWARAREGARYETGDGYTLFRIQRNQPPWSRGLYREWVIGPQWKQYYVAERFDHDLPEGQAVAAFSGGYPAQQIEIAGLEIYNLGPEVDPLSLPAMEVSYQGSEPDAAWREQARERIEQVRKGPLRVEVVDAHGQPVAGARVHAEMTRHAFHFGTAISAKWLDQHWDTPEGETYRQHILQNFNSVAIENALKWSAWEANPEVALRTLRWAKEQGLHVHGHVLVWPGLEKFRVRDAPQIWSAAQDDPQLLRDRINDHIRDILQQTQGLVDVWDVVNEAYNQNDFIKLLGEPEIAEWFKLADQYAPSAELMYNDFGLLGSSGTNRLKHQFVIDLVRGVKQRGGRIDAVGLQSHMGSGYTPPPRVLDIINQFAAEGVKLKITEYDLMVAEQPEVAEQYTRDYLTAIFSHPEVVGFTGWNFWSATPTWFPEAAYFGDDWRPLPVGRAYLDLVRGAWWTDVQATTDAQGACEVRGFYGDYLVTVETDGRTQQATATLAPDGEGLRVQLE